MSVRPLAVIGRMSYGLYLWHLPIFYAVHESLPHASTRVTTVLGVSLSVAVAALNRHYVEAPFLALKNRLHARPAVIPEPPIAAVAIG
jgi:peptidoglycan/LPS O-acetylase OafA/YrhL